jgi:trehalose-6-phosphate synthase
MRLVIVSNRLPFTASVGKEGPHFTASSGGLTTGLSDYLARPRPENAEPLEFMWFGWPGTDIAPEHQEAVKEHGKKHFHVSPVFLPEESMDRFYHGFSIRRSGRFSIIFPHSLATTRITGRNINA